MLTTQLCVSSALSFILQFILITNDIMHLVAKEYILLVCCSFMAEGGIDTQFQG